MNSGFSCLSESLDKSQRTKSSKNNQVTTFDDYELTVKNRKNRDIVISIIMPSYNKYEYVSLSLYCLLKQNFNYSKFEVILIDDCSNDKTRLIPMEFDPPFKFKYIRLFKNQGRSRARNIGIIHAEGEIVIFLDGEMLTEPDFIENHYSHHIGKEGMVVCGAFHYRGIYTFLTSKFNTQQWQHIDSFVTSNPYYSFHYKEFKRNYQDTEILFPLITHDDIDNKLYDSLSFPNWYFTKELNSGIKDFGIELNHFTLPYIAFLTGDVSVSRKLLDKVGYFDESFLGYGAEDWELGYRLYKSGARFILDPLTFCYHQEHPTSPNNFPEAVGNLYKFMKKHPNFDVLALALEHQPALNFTQIHFVVSDYNKLCDKYPGKYKQFKQVFETMLFKLVENLRDSKPVINLHECDTSMIPKIMEQLNEIKTHQFYALANTFEDLFSL
ncbi:glycosyltransferase [Bacillus sp. V3B]|uniref:glycosyltransferase family 2 protein n=1 Tax=Bacillus sp. V3B TaxID=2804915 RepID=UPI00210BA56E|nr:glycosyltransferase [Bacillus sp. V3B]MCQ6275182.1 glycosyltransferase [Bacillus sp. V3B]